MTQMHEPLTNKHTVPSCMLVPQALSGRSGIRPSMVSHFRQLSAIKSHIFFGDASDDTLLEDLRELINHPGRKITQGAFTLEKVWERFADKNALVPF